MYIIAILCALFFHNLLLHAQFIAFQLIVILIPAKIIAIFCPGLPLVNAFAAIQAASDRF